MGPLETSRGFTSWKCVLPRCDAAEECAHRLSDGHICHSLTLFWGVRKQSELWSCSPPCSILSLWFSGCRRLVPPLQRQAQGGAACPDEIGTIAGSKRGSKNVERVPKWKGRWRDNVFSGLLPFTFLIHGCACYCVTMVMLLLQVDNQVDFFILDCWELFSARRLFFYFYFLNVSSEILSWELTQRSSLAYC